MLPALTHLVLLEVFAHLGFLWLGDIVRIRLKKQSFGPCRCEGKLWKSWYSYTFVQLASSKSRGQKSPQFVIWKKKIPWFFNTVSQFLFSESWVIVFERLVLAGKCLVARREQTGTSEGTFAFTCWPAARERNCPVFGGFVLFFFFTEYNCNSKSGTPVLLQYLLLKGQHDGKELKAQPLDSPKYDSEGPGNSRSLEETNLQLLFSLGLLVS